MNLRQLVVALALLSTAHSAAPDLERALAFPKRIENTVYRASVVPHWLPDGRRFWYRVQTGPTAWEFVLVEADSGRIQRAAEAAALGIETRTLTTSRDTTTELQSSTSHGVPSSVRFVNRLAQPVELVWIDSYAVRKPFGHVAPGASRDMKTFAGHVWQVKAQGGATLGVLRAEEEPLELVIDGKGRAPQRPRSEVSPDGRWAVRFAEHQIVLHDTLTGEATPLTRDGIAAQPYRGPVAWAPDGQSFVVLSVKDAPARKVTLVEAAPGGQLQPKVHTLDYAKPGDELPRPCPVLVRLSDCQPQRIADALFPNHFSERGSLAIRWAPGSHEFTFDYNQRGHQLWRILGVDVATGTVRTIVEEKSSTFIDYTQKTWRHWLDDSSELLWMSERDGWCHLWLYDAATGAVKNQVTRGAWVVREVVRVDEKRRKVWFLASGLRAGEDPYQQHLCRASFDGSGFTQLTTGDGDHHVSFSPDGRYFIDRWSRADLPPAAELRRSEDGALVTALERADVNALLATGWTMPERFVAKGRDGKTDIHGILVKPSHFDPATKYPVVEEVYAGPHSAFAPKGFDPLPRLHAIAEAGFIVVKADGMGTNHRGKAFHDVAWKNLRDAGFPDRIAWIKAAASTRPWMDLTRVGIFGGSAGGQNAMRALLDHADFYQAAVADCGCHDNRMDKIWWNEQWLGWPVDESYARNSNVTDAARLRGRLLLLVGEVDRNVDPASTMQVVAALQTAGKDFEFMPIAGSGHSAAETAYGSRVRLQFLARHLLGGNAAPSHRTEQIEGWTVHVSERLREVEPNATERALALLKAQLAAVARLLPPAAVTELRKVPLWISPEYHGVPPRAEYHPDEGWLRANGRDPAMAKAVEFTNVRIFDAEVKRMPVFVLHELAHAYHDRVLGFANAEIEAAYEHAKSAKLYDAVERRRTDGRPNSIERAYAMTNGKEYFAETSEAFFGTNDFFPFDRAELEKHDPGMAKLLARLWGVAR